MGIWIAGLGFLAIAVATLTPVDGGGGVTSRLCLICHSRGMADFLSNIILFMPLAFGLALHGWSLRRTALAALLLSLVIESLQVRVIAGRDSNVGDLAANSLGGVIGWLVWRTSGWWRPRQHAALARMLSVAGATLAVLIGALTLLVPAPQSTTYFMQWTADLGRLEHYDGQVLESRLGPVELHGSTRVEPGRTVRQQLLEPSWNVRFIAGHPPSALAPIVSIYDNFQQEVVFLGADNVDLVHRQRLRAGALRFDEPDLRVWSALASMQPGDTVTLAWRADRKSTCVTVDQREACRYGFTVGDTWALLMFPDSWGRGARTAMSVAWLFGIFLPAGFLGYRRSHTLIGSVLVLATLVAVPPVLGFAMTPAHQVVMALAGLSAGHLAAVTLRGRTLEHEQQALE